MNEEKDTVLQFLITAVIFLGWLVLCEDVGSASLAAMVWILWLIYRK
jgi:hypothetical protein